MKTISELSPFEVTATYFRYSTSRNALVNLEVWTLERCIRRMHEKVEGSFLKVLTKDTVFILLTLFQEVNVVLTIIKGYRARPTVSLAPSKSS